MSSKKNQFLSSTCNVSRAVVAVRVANESIDKQKNRFFCHDAMNRAMDAGRAENYAAAQAELKRAEEQIKRSATVASPYCQTLLAQLAEGQREVQSSVEWNAKGKSTLATYTRSHTQQRSTHRTPTYSTTTKTNCVNNYSFK